MIEAIFGLSLATICLLFVTCLVLIVLMGLPLLVTYVMIKLYNAVKSAINKG